MNSTRNAQDDWFNELPKEAERKQFRDAMLECFARQVLPINKPDSMNEPCLEILLRIQTQALLWESATARQASQGSRRFKAHVDQLRNAYERRDETHAAVAARVIANQKDPVADNQRTTRSTASHKIDANIDSECSSKSGRSGKNSKPKTKQPAKETKRGTVLSQKMKDEAVEIVLEHLKTYIDKRDMHRSTYLQARVLHLEHVNRKAHKYI